MVSEVPSVLTASRLGVWSTLFLESPDLLVPKQASVSRSAWFCFHKAKPTGLGYTELRGPDLAGEAHPSSSREMN